MIRSGKQQLSEKDCFWSKYFDEMTSRVSVLKDARGIGLFVASLEQPESRIRYEFFKEQGCGAFAALFQL